MQVGSISSAVDYAFFLSHGKTYQKTQKNVR